MAHEPYCGTDVDFEWKRPEEGKKFYESMLNDILELNGTVVSRVTDIEFGSDALDGQFTGICIPNRIFCTHNNYKRNTKTLIL